MKTLCIIACIISFCQIAEAQNNIIGTVWDEHGQRLPGVNVYLKDTYDGASTDIEGNFSFKTTESNNQIIVASFIGYKTYEGNINLDSAGVNIRIVLREEVNKIDGVTITAGAFEASDKKKSVVLKTFDIVTTAGATADITGVMNTLPGTQAVGESGKLFVRGGSGNEAKTFINGMLTAEPYGFTPNNIPSRFRFSPFLFKGAFFSTGGYSAEYGQALSSVLQLNTYDLPAESQTDISLMTVGGDVSQTIRKDNCSIYGQIQYTNLAPTFALVPQKYTWENAPNAFNSTLHFKQKFGDGGNFQVYANYEQSSMTIEQPVPGNIDDLSTNDINSNNFYGNFSFNNPLGKTMSVHGGISYSGNKSQIKTEQFIPNYNLNTIHSKLVFDRDLSENIQLKFGGEWFYNTYDERITDKENTPVQNLDYNNNIISSFAEADIYFSNKLVTRIGIRYEYDEISDINNVTPRASLAYKLDKSSQFSIAYGKFSQIPAADYLKWSEKLKPETASHYILNYQYEKEGRIFRTELYYKNYDQLVLGNIDLTGESSLTNSGYGDAKGIELFWRDSRTFESVDYWISYSFLDTKRKYGIFPYPVMPYFASAHNLSVVYKHFISGIKSMIGATYSFASGRPYTNPNTNKFNSERTKSYNDLSVNYSYLLKTNLIIHASISNVFGFNNIYGYQYNDKPNNEGVFESIPIGPQSKRFLFVGFFITISKNKNANQLNNL